MKKTDFNCPGCGQPGTRELKKKVCISKRPELKEDILSGSFFEWECPECGKRFFIDDVFLYNEDELMFMVYYVPGFDKDVLKVPTVIKTDTNYDTEHSVLRVASSFIDFVEKIRILEEGLDDRAIEAIKAVYAAAYREACGADLYNMIFEETAESGALCFAVFLQDKDFTVEIPDEAYRQTKSDFSSLFGEPGEKAFLRIDQDWLAGVLGQNDA
jgi:hypothetical protein